MKKKITIIAPMYNEEETVKKYTEEVLSIFKNISNDYIAEIILVDDGSKDNTFKEMMEIKNKYTNNIGIIKLSRNFGLEGAISAGLEKASGDAVITMDADLQDPPEVILQLIHEWENGAEIVQAKRHKRLSDSFFKRITAKLFYKTINVMSGRMFIEEEVANYRLLSRKIVNKINSLKEVNRVFRVMVPYLGYKVSTIEYNRNNRYSGQTKYNLKSMISYAIDSITSISVQPLRMISLLFIISIFILLFSLYNFIINNPFETIWGCTSIICFLFCLLFFGLSLIGEYIAQIFIEQKKRPNHIIELWLETHFNKGIK